MESHARFGQIRDQEEHRSLVWETCPPGLRVVVNGYEEGYDDLSPEQVFVVNIQLNVGMESWEGRHGDVRDHGEDSLQGWGADARDHSQQRPSSGASENALVLSRLSN